MSGSDKLKTDQREPYAPPQISEIGSVRELTAGVMGNGTDATGKTSV
jgi:hypothetical protein